MGDKKPIHIVITKYYLLAWLSGLIALFLVYENCIFTAAIFVFFFLSYSVADFMGTLPPIKPPDEPPTNGDGPRFV